MAALSLYARSLLLILFKVCVRCEHCLNEPVYLRNTKPRISFRECCRTACRQPLRPCRNRPFACSVGKFARAVPLSLFVVLQSFQSRAKAFAGDQAALRVSGTYGVEGRHKAAA